MKALKRHKGIAAPLDRVNVDTDQIIPKQFLKRVERTGFGEFLFFDWRYKQNGDPKGDFVLNQPEYEEATVLVAGDNFGCGSSREHAPWALLDYGFKVIIAPSFADIFYNNCFKNGMLPIALTEAQVQDLFKRIENHEGYQLQVDVESERLSDDYGLEIEFEIDAFRKECLLKGLDEIDITLQHEEKIAAYEAREGSQSTG